MITSGEIVIILLMCDIIYGLRVTTVSNNFKFLVIYAYYHIISWQMTWFRANFLTPFLMASADDWLQCGI